MEFGWILQGLGVLLAGIAVLLLSTLVFDAIHFLLHVFMASSQPVLRVLGSLHAAHHEFLDGNLDLHEAYRSQNLLEHVVPEYLTQLSVSALLAQWLPLAVVGVAAAFQTLVFLLILRARGEDINHHSIHELAAYDPMFFCLPPYHALHHVYPDAHFSSWIKALDYLLARGAWLEGRRVTLTGADTPLGDSLAEELERQTGVPVRRLDASTGRGPDGGAALARVLDETDVLVLCHEPDERGAGAAEWIERFRDAARGRLLPIEVWSLSGAPAWERRARRYYFDERVIYRHLDRHGRESPAPAADARRILRSVRRGFNHVPLVRGPRALVAFLRFRFRPGGRGLLPAG